MSWCALTLGEACSHVATLLFNLEAACRLGYSNPSRISLLCRLNQSFKTEVQFHYMWRHQLPTYDIVSGNSSWVNWYWIYQAKAQQNSWTSRWHKLPAARIKVTGGPQDLTKIKAETLHNSIYELVPQLYFLC